MKRREFFTASVGVGALVARFPGCAPRAEKRSALVTENSGIAGLSLQTLREQYRYDLFDDFLPFMQKYVIDREYGGFMCTVDRDGTRINTDKHIWFEGRGIWVYSFLYNNLAKKEEYLDVARRSVDFVLKIQPKGDALWPKFLTRDGKPKSKPPAEVYGDLFVAEGLAEYSTASGEPEYWDIAREIVLKCVRIYDRDDYNPAIGRTYLGPDAKPFPGARILGVWMVLLRTVTQMLRSRRDQELEALADRCVEAVMEAHYNPEFRLLNELLNHDLTRPTDEYAQLVYTGHAIETLWMVLDEAVRRKDKGLFDKAAERFRRHVRVAWDDIYGGVFHNLQNVEQNLWTLSKTLWAQEEVLIGSLMVVEHTGAAWAQQTFREMYDYVQDKFPLKQYGFPLWILYADRKVTFERHSNRVGNYHHPRHLMLNLLALDRIIDRGGRVSGLFG